MECFIERGESFFPCFLAPPSPPSPSHIFPLSGTAYLNAVVAGTGGMLWRRRSYKRTFVRFIEFARVVGYKHILFSRVRTLFFYFF